MKKSDDLTKAIENLDDSVEDLDDSIKQSLKLGGWRATFARGIVGAIGAAVGATIIIGLMVYLLQKLAGAPFVGDLFRLLLQQLQQNK